MRNRIMSLILLFALVFTVITPVMSFAQDGKYTGNGNHYVTETGDYKFNISFEGVDVDTTDVLEINLPVKADISNNDYFTHEWIEKENNNFILKLTPKDSFSKVEGQLKGSGKFSVGEKIIPIKIGNKIITNEIEVAESNETPGERESFYKAGRISEDGKHIQWDINIKKGMAEKVWLSDELGEGQKLIEDSFSVNIVNEHQIRSLQPEHGGLGVLDGANSFKYNNNIVVWAGTKISDDEFHLMVDTSDLNDGEYLQIVYLAEITNPKQSLFANSYQLADTKKKLSIVEVEFDSSFDGERPKPENPEPSEPEPENPDPDNPEPDNPDPVEPDPNLPQVGEEFNILAIGLLVVGLFQLIRSER